MRPTGPLGLDEPARHLGGPATLSARIVAQVRAALFGGGLRPGAALGGEKEIAARFGVSRIVARDALKRLEAMGVVEIRPGAGGGARIATGNTQLFADALAIQLNLTGATVAEIMDAQRAVETVTAELAALHATAEDMARLEALLREHEAVIDDRSAYTRSCYAFHLAIAQAAHNRVLLLQLVSLQHVAWPENNHTLTPDVAQHILALHKELFVLIRARDAEGARDLMSRHLKQIRARRVAEDSQAKGGACC